VISAGANVAKRNVFAAGSILFLSGPVQ